MRFLRHSFGQLLLLSAFLTLMFAAGVVWCASLIARIADAFLTD